MGTWSQAWMTHQVSQAGRADASVAQMLVAVLAGALCRRDCR